ncbi:hypothetical protein [Mesorhizobium escarrei]|uniref:Uncharacterized protein n=1 Tax=Mesorhizobium escarrei TaxID=666018 RepID=A0ABM9DVX3_9HYPH|nr:hypothetical protein [Mesorhizobium escarrei]CAH2400855.1 hypothetical protein MES5069_270093 [Mesorhizobium escarrei]
MGRINDRVALISGGAAGEVAVDGTMSADIVAPVTVPNPVRAWPGTHSCR